MFSLAAIRERFTAHEITNVTSDGEETVFCVENEDGYVGWVTREAQRRLGYTPHKTQSDPAVLALLDLAEAVVAYTQVKSVADLARVKQLVRTKASVFKEARPPKEE